MNNEKHSIEFLKPWGNYQSIKSRLFFLKKENIPCSLKEKEFIVYANGRSYGDCSLNENVLKTSSLNSIISFNAKKGILQCQSGILLSEIINKIIPHKWFLPITPGTKYITLGGAVAADVHGKNHHNAGCFSEFIINLKLLLPDGSIITCSKTEKPSLFKATCGGMGLTGIILEITLQLKPIKSALINQETVATKNLKETFKVFDNFKKATYVVSWIDCFSKKENLGKAITFIGEHATDNNFDFSFPKTISIPKFFPYFILNDISIRIYNLYYYLRQANKTKKVPLNTFFYPLDSIDNWNRIYGKKGFVQYQVVIPKTEGYQGILKLLEKVKTSKHVSYLTILKLLGKENENYLSFPFEGYTIAMDFKVKNGLWSFLKELDIIVSKFNGRAYLAKDGRMSRSFFEKGYSNINSFKAIRKKYGLERLQSLQSKRLGL